MSEQHLAGSRVPPVRGEVQGCPAADRLRVYGCGRALKQQSQCLRPARARSLVYGREAALVAGPGARTVVQERGQGLQGPCGGRGVQRRLAHGVPGLRIGTGRQELQGHSSPVLLAGAVQRRLAQAIFGAGAGPAVQQQLRQLSVAARGSHVEGRASVKVHRCLHRQGPVDEERVCIQDIARAAVLPQGLQEARSLLLPAPGPLLRADVVRGHARPRRPGARVVPLARAAAALHPVRRTRGPGPEGLDVGQVAQPLSRTRHRGAAHLGYTAARHAGIPRAACPPWAGSGQPPSH
mmetsp:Transcript_5038/g.15366  ORF Transcript_5038/g.15366 Transcript_5038/m.15366 type:complete len:294 (-) Transcript_5038:14-895(-)